MVSDMLIIYTTVNCPNCHAQMTEWKKANIPFEERPIQELLEDGKLLTDYIVKHNGEWPMQAPVIREGDVWQ